MNLLAFRWGRMAVVDASASRPRCVHGPRARPRRSRVLSAEARALVDAAGATGELRRLLEIRVPELIDYQDAAYARRYVEFVTRVAGEERGRRPAARG